MASIHKTVYGTWEVKYRVCGRLQSKTFKRKEDARQFGAKAELGEREAEIPCREGGDVAAGVQPLTFVEFSEIWVRDHAEVHKTESSVIHDRQMIRDYLLPSLGRLSLVQIQKRDLTTLQARLKKQTKLSNKTINMVVATAQKMLTDAIEWDMLSAGRSFKIKKLICPEVDYTFWSMSERDRFLSYVKSRDPWMYEIVAFTVNTGLRRGEVQALQRDCIDFENRQFTVKRSYCSKTNMVKEHTKGKNIRQVPMNDDVYGILQDRRLLAPSQRIFPDDLAHFVARRFKPAQKEAGVTVISFHDLRHTFASHLAMSGVPVFKVQKVLGHADLQTTMRYAHLAPGELKGLTDVLVTSDPMVGRLVSGSVRS